MIRSVCAAVLFLCCALARGAAPPAREVPDRLPDGARVRLGTLDLRHGSGVAAIAFSPAGNFLATGGGEFPVCLWDPRIGKEVRRLPRRTEATVALAFSRDGRRLLTRQDTGLQVWDVEKGTLLRSLETRVSSANLSPDGKLLALRGDEPSILDVDTGKKRFPIPGDLGGLLLFAGDETLVVARRWGSKVSLLDSATGKLLKQLPEKGRYEYISALAVTADGKRLAIGHGTFLRVVETQSGKEVAVLGDRHCGATQCLAFSPDGNTVFARDTVTAGVLRWDLRTGTHRPLPPPLGRHNRQTQTLAVSPDGRTLATLDGIGAFLQDADTGKPVLPFKGHQGPIVGAAFAGGKTPVTAGADGTLRFWDPYTGRETRRLALEEAPQSALLAADGRTLVGADSRLVRMWDLEKGTLLRKFYCPGGPRAVALGAPSLLAVASCASWRGGAVTVRDLASGDFREFRPHPYPKDPSRSDDVRGLAFSPDGKRLATVIPSGTLLVHDPDGKLLWQRPLGPDAPWFGLAFSPDGELLAAIDPVNGNVLLLDAVTGKLLGTLEGSPPNSQTPAFSPDRRLLAVPNGSRVTLFDLPARQALRTLDGHRGAVGQVSFNRDGRQLLSASEDGTAVLWDLIPPAKGPLTPQELRALWGDLAGAAVPGHRAAANLAAHSEVLPWIISQIKKEGKSLNSTRAVRLAQALEWLGTPEAEGILKLLPGEDAQTSLARLAARAKPTPALALSATHRGPTVHQLHAGEVTALAFSPGGARLASTGTDGRLLVSDAKSGEVVLDRHAHDGGAFGLDFSPDGKLLATCGADRRARVWDLSTGKEIRCLELGAAVACIAFSPATKPGRAPAAVMLAVGSYDGKVTFFDLPGFAPRSFSVIEGRATSLSFSPDGASLAVGGTTTLATGKGHLMAAAARAVVLDVDSGRPVRELDARGSNVAFTPTGGMVLTAGLVPDADWDGFDDVSLSDPLTGAVALGIPWRGHGLAVSPCGRLFATAAGSKRHLDSAGANLIAYRGGINAERTSHSLRIWELGSGREVLAFGDEPDALAFSPDGRLIAAGMSEGVVLVWDLAREASAKAPAEKDLARLGSLAGEPPAAFGAQGGLTLAGDRGVSLIAGALSPAKGPTKEELTRLVILLEEGDFREREEALARLRGLADLAESALRRALRGKPSLELQRRVERLLRPLQEPRLSPERLRQRRAVAVLEQVGSEAARRALRRLAEGAADAALTREARAALGRLAAQEGK